MKILFLNYEYPPLGGGAGICTKYEAEGLAKLGHQVTIITTWFKGEKEEEILINNDLKIIKLKSKRLHTFKSNPIEMLSYSRKAREFLKEYLKTNNFDICIANYALPGGNVAIQLKKKFNLPYLIISHGHDIPWFFPKQMFKFHLATYHIIKRICKNAERIILLTTEMKNNADKFMKNNKEKNIIIENGADLFSFYPDYRKRSKIFKIIFVGRLRDQKDPMTFLKAINLFKKQNPNINFIVDILGDGPLLKKMQDYIEKNNLKDNINIKGWVDKKEMLKEYQEASVQVMTSVAEAMSIAVLESLATGQYIISTRVSGNTDMIKQGINGEFIDMKNPAELANKIKQFHDTKFKKAFRVPDSSIRELKSKYDWQIIVNKYDALLKEMMKEVNK